MIGIGRKYTHKEEFVDYIATEEKEKWCQLWTKTKVQDNHFIAISTINISEYLILLVTYCNFKVSGLNWMNTLKWDNLRILLG